MDDPLYFGKLWARWDYEGDGDESDVLYVILTACQRSQLATDLKRSYFETGDVNRNDSENGGNADLDVYEAKEASQAHDGSTQNVED
jgi:hypothetical protein